MLDQGKHWQVQEQLLSVEGFVEVMVARYGGHRWRARPASTRTPNATMIGPTGGLAAPGRLSR